MKILPSSEKNFMQTNIQNQRFDLIIYGQKSKKTKSRIGQNPKWTKSELEKIQNGKNSELEKIPNGQNLELDKIPKGQNTKWTKLSQHLDWFHLQKAKGEIRVQCSFVRSSVARRNWSCSALANAAITQIMYQMICPSEPNSKRFNLLLCHVLAMYQRCSISASFEWFRLPKRMVFYFFLSVGARYGAPFVCTNFCYVFFDLLNK